MCILLRLRRFALDWSQSTLRRICGTDSSRIENGKTDPTVSRFIRICKGLKTSPGWLLVLLEMNESGVLSDRELLDIVKNWDDYKNAITAVEVMIAKSIVEKQQKESKVG